MVPLYAQPVVRSGSVLVISCVDFGRIAACCDVGVGSAVLWGFFDLAPVNVQNLFCWGAPPSRADGLH
eukprot:scaffold8845_cov83-Skeletonema_dohrnii-CCMP3373.AAC.1